MANHKSALKRVRQSEKRRLRNKTVKTRIKNLVKAARESAAQTPAQSSEALQAAVQALDKAAGRGVLHRRTASRRIARLSRLVFKSQSGSPA
ncbi:MAG: 30S ribosomal protein S20 [Thermodesulfobacteriota bacterium]